MPKKPPKNAFFYYMLHFKEQERRRGRHYPGGLSEVSTAASESWRGMSGQQRGPFEKQAKDAKVGPQKDTEKYTSQGVPLSVIDRERKQVESDVGTMLRTIKSTVLDAFIDNTIGSREFILISGNFFLKIAENNYLPAEIGMVKFTFDNGIVNKFHTYVDPENVPLGYKFDAKDYSDKTHRLPIPPNAKGERNYNHILNEMKKFMGEPTPILFTSKDNIPIIKSFMRTFVDFGHDEDADPVDRYRVYPLHQLFYEIKEEAVRSSLEGQSFRSIHIAEEHLRREDFAYLAGTACTYHDDLDCAKHCALAHVQNWAYIFFDHILVDLNIQPIVGKHFPSEIDVSHIPDVTQIDISVSKLNDTGNTKTNIDEGHSSRSVAWTGRPKSPVSKLKQNDDFPTLGSRNNRKRPNQKPSSDNPWNTSSSSSSDSNPWNQRPNSEDKPSFMGSDLDASYSRGMGRGSVLFRSESGFGRGRSHK